jgi:hypothetical protein
MLTFAGKIILTVSVFLYTLFTALHITQLINQIIIPGGSQTFAPGKWFHNHAKLNLTQKLFRKEWIA